MAVPKPLGREAASRKYDLLSAMMAFALSGDKHRQRQVMRLMVLITARYNWQRDELSMGQEAIATLWSVDPRTVKREMAKLRALGWLVQKRAGCRGRVAVYGLDIARILQDTRPAWPALGPDFAQRVDPPTATAPQSSNIVPLHPVAAPEISDALWSQVLARLHSEDPATYGAWFQHLTSVESGAGHLTLMAPTSFQASYIKTHLLDRLRLAVATQDPSITQVRILST